MKRGDVSVTTTAEKALVRQLLESEARFERVFQSTLIGIGITEVSSGRFIDVNDCWAAFFGYSRDEMITRTAVELRLWADPADRDRLVASVGAGGSVSRLEADFRSKSGEIRHAMVSMGAMALADMPLHIVVLVDMTERKRAEIALRESRDRLRQVEEYVREVFGIELPPVKGQE
jgi:PAS domain S-box-containing protein